MKKILYILILFTSRLSAQSDTTTSSTKPVGSYTYAPTFARQWTGNDFIPSIFTGVNWWGLATRQWVNQTKQQNQSLPTIGIILNDNFTRTSLGSNYTVSGTGFSIINNKLQLSYSGTSSLNNYIVYNGYGNSNSVSNTVTANITAGTITATNDIVTLNYQPNATVNNTSFQVGLNMYNGVITFFSNGILTNASMSLQGMSISTGDNLIFSVKMYGRKNVATVINLTTGKSNSMTQVNPLDYNSALFPFYANSYRFGLGMLGGTNTVTNFAVSLDDNIGVDVLTVGDSIDYGFYAGAITNTWTELLAQYANVSVETNAGPGNTIEDLNVNEIISLKPKKIILSVGINNLNRNQSLSSIQTKYQILVNSLVSAGYTIGSTLYLAQITPCVLYTSNIPAFNTWLVNTYGQAATIDFYTPLQNGAGAPLYQNFDGVHPNDVGNRLMANQAISTLKLPAKTKKVGDYNPVLYSDNGFLGIGENKTRSFKPRYLTDIVSSLYSPQLHLSSQFEDNGFYGLSYLGNTHLTNELKIINGVFYNTTANGGSGINLNNDLMNLYVTKPGVIGAATTPLVFFRGTHSTADTSKAAPAFENTNDLHVTNGNDFKTGGNSDLMVSPVGNAGSAGSVNIQASYPGVGFGTPLNLQPSGGGISVNNSGRSPLRANFDNYGSSYLAGVTQTNRDSYITEPSSHTALDKVSYGYGSSTFANQGINPDGTRNMDLISTTGIFRKDSLSTNIVNFPIVTQSASAYHYGTSTRGSQIAMDLQTDRIFSRRAYNGWKPWNEIIQVPFSSYTIGQVPYWNGTGWGLYTPSPARQSVYLQGNQTLALNSDYLQPTSTQAQLTLPPCSIFANDGSKIITVLCTGSGGAKIIVPNTYIVDSPSGLTHTDGTGYITLTQRQKVQIIPIATNYFYIQPLNGSITVY